MIKLFEVSLCNNGWVISYPPEDEEHIIQDSLYLDNKEGITTMMYDIMDALSIDYNEYTVTVKKRKVKKDFWKEIDPDPIPPVKE